MVVSFDSFNRLETPQLILCNPACVYVDGDTTNAVGEIHNQCDTEIVANFNAMSELNFRLYCIQTGNESRDVYSKFIYDGVQTRRCLYVPDIGYFCITSCDETLSDEMKYKDVQAKSAEYELECRNIPYIADGTYLLYDGEGGGVLDKLLTVATNWSVGEIDEDLEDVYRTFEDVSVDTDIYTFLTDNIQKAYDCIVIFDILNRTISVYLRSNYIVDTDIHLTQKDWIESLVVKEDADNIYTALRVTGGDELGIASVNPLRTNVLYDFSHYTSWMSSGLATKVATWQALVASKEVEYYTNALSYYNLYDDKVDTQLEIERLNIVLGLYQECKANIQATQSASSVDWYNSLIEANGGTSIEIEATIQDTIDEIDGLISTTQGDITAGQSSLATIEANMETYSDAMDAIYDAIKMSAYFTTAEKNELSFYIFEGNYEYEYVTTNDTMDEYDKAVQARKLMSQGETTLSKVASSSKTVEVNSESFVFIRKFADWSQQLQTGCIIHIEMAPDDIVMMYLDSISVDYEGMTAVMKFGNKLDRKDSRTLFDNVFENVSRSSNSVVF